MNKLFVYGIFLGEGLRNAYGMSNPQYATVDGYATEGNHIVQARKVDSGWALTGLLVDVAPFSMGRNGNLRDSWAALDMLEGGYDRVEITTTGGDKAYMYVGKEYSDQSEKSSDTASG